MSAEAAEARVAVRGSGDPPAPIAPGELREALLPGLRRLASPDRRLLVLIPDGTRTLPMPELFALLCEALAGGSKKLTFLVALGTHRRMSEAELRRHLGGPWRGLQGVEVLQHDWANPEMLASVGTLARETVAGISRGLIDEDVPVRVNRQLLEHDLALLVGPVYPHELIGFSGGFKYYFPGVSGPEFVHHSHWLGSVVVNPWLQGRKQTPVRQLVDTAASLVPTASVGLSLVVQGARPVGAFLGPVREAWAEAADLSARVNVRLARRPFHTVIACAPRMYDDLWTGGKCVTKLQGVVAEGGTLLLYAPHIRRASASHGDWHRKVGYHLPEYVLQNLERFREVPRAVLGDLIQLRGPGVVRGGVEIPRFQTVLATGIPAEQCREMNVAYRDPASVDLRAHEGREQEGVLVVREAGEVLWRLAAEA